MTPDERDKLLDLHRKAIHTQCAYDFGNATDRAMNKADDEFRDYLFSLEVSA
ncbi:hypothetical protein [Arthrobacter sp. FW306-06-A]|uniref:hypothetical protein n=1 Tax=Arthrobacter sp. FW306-06-A TaxID=2879621 RepID=UPI001F2A2804|nr:hypothetical protein [Arthrobacter sp. FW306-06-A]UKA69538.1 hypothetical protein LFT49_12220 [Arthrobacter sp. FW306-06-A]